MSFAAAVADMDALLLSEDGFGEPARLTPAGGGSVVTLTAIIDEPTEQIPGIVQPMLRERRIALRLPLPAAASAARGDGVAVDVLVVDGVAQTTRSFTLDAQLERQPNYVRFAALEVTA